MPLLRIFDGWDGENVFYLPQMSRFQLKNGGKVARDTKRNRCLEFMGKYEYNN